MKEDLMEILCCPVCRADLRLEVSSRDPKDDEILAGTLTCTRCGHAYPIDEGIPNLLPPEDASEA